MAGIDQYTVLMLHMQGANDAALFPDSSYANPKTIIAENGAVTITGSAMLGQTSSGYFNGNGNLQIDTSPDFSFGTADFTVEAWVDITGWSTDNCATVFSGITNNDFMFGLIGAGAPSALGIGRAAIAWDNQLPASISENAWHHVAVARQGTTAYFFVDGTLIGTGANSTNYSVASNACACVQAGGHSVLAGYMQELRISKGIARWTSSFTPPSLPYSVSAPVEYIMQIPVTIDNTLGGALAGYQHAITIDTASLVATSKMRSDCGDLRILDTDGVTPLPYWFDPATANTAATVVYVAKSMAAAGVATIYLQCGSLTNIVTTADGAAVFDLFDDFLGSSLASHWTLTSGAAPVIAGSLATFNTSCVIKAESCPIGIGYAIIGHGKIPGGAYQWFGGADVSGATSCIEGYDSYNYNWESYDTWRTGNTETTIPSLNGNHVLEIRYVSATERDYYIDGLLQATSSGSASPVHFPTINITAGGGAPYFDLVYVRQHVVNAPIITFGEASAANIYQIPITINNNHVTASQLQINGGSYYEPALADIQTWIDAQYAINPDVKFYLYASEACGQRWNAVAFVGDGDVSVTCPGGQTGPVYLSCAAGLAASWVMIQGNTSMNYQTNLTAVGAVSSQLVDDTAGGYFYFSGAIAPSASPALPGYQHVITIDTASLIAAGKMQSDCADIRAIDSNGTQLPFWIVPTTVNTSSTRIYVKRSMAAGEVATIYIQHGDLSALSASDGGATFDFFDDFNDGAFNPEVWTIRGNGATVSNGVMTCNQARVVTTSFQTEEAAVIECRAESTSGDEASIDIARYSPNYLTDNNSQGVESSSYNEFFFSTLNANTTFGSTIGYNDWYTFTFTTNGTELSFNRYSDNFGTVESSASYNDIGNLTSGYLAVGCVVYDGRNAIYDWILCRQYAAVVPSVTVGSDEEATITVSNSIDAIYNINTATQVISSLIGVYNILKDVHVSCTSLYDILTGAQSSLTGQYNILKGASSSISAEYKLGNTIHSSISASYNLMGVPVVYKYTVPDVTMPVMKKRKGFYRGPIDSAAYNITTNEADYDINRLGLHLGANQTLIRGIVNNMTTSILDFARRLTQ